MVQSVFAVFLSLNLFLWYGRNKKAPKFVILICMCIIFATLFARAFSVMQSQEYLNLPSYPTYKGEEWKELAMPFRATASALGTLAHWFLTE